MHLSTGLKEQPLPWTCMMQAQVPPPTYSLHVREALARVMKENHARIVNIIKL